ncbi:hypothetical protein OR1_02118 [Geobacter sp. OR-1]|uniref:hypothetical protein n=1 Tax=Geobacter sp. OR-1 TaxID=1266765 RepID=UPI0005429E1F|nr:hypothetical protein [Geobacter sp. OR-1]GAM09836.1 hypothetical protein OR1_02118 [Geobacter sp. OR-1]
MRFTDGRLTAGTLLDASWEATVDRPASRDRNLAARLGPVRIDLRQGLALAAPLLARPLPIRELAGELRLQQLEARLQGRTRGEITLSGLGLDLTRLRLPLAQGELTATGVNVAVEKATLPLEAMQPSRIDAQLSWASQRCSVAGKQPVVADGMSGGLQVAVKELNLKSRSPRKISAKIDLRQSFDLQRLSLERTLAVDALHEQLTAQVYLRDNGEIEMTRPEMKFTLAALQGIAGGKKLRPLPLTAVLTATNIRLPAAKGARPSVEHASGTVTAGGAVQLSATGALSPGQQAVTDGTLRIDLDRALPLAAPFLPKGVACGGITTLTWNLAALAGQKPQAKEKNPLRMARSSLGLIDRGELTMTLANRAITWPLANGKLTLAELRTPRPVRLALPGKDGKLRLEGELAFARLSGLPGAGATLPAQSGTLSFDGELSDWQSLKLREQFKIQPLGLSQRADVAIGRLDSLLEQESITTAALLQRLDATIITEAAAGFPAKLTPIPGGMELSGKGNAGLRLNLTAGRGLRVHATAATRDFGLRLKNGTTIEGMTADLLFERDYALARGKETGWTPLSASLVRPLPEQSGSAGATELTNRVREDLRGQEHDSRRFTIRRLVAGNGKTPLELTALEGDLLLTPEEMGLSFFQAETLGGTIRLRGMIDLRPEVPAVSAACSFSNLETFMLLPPEVRQESRTQKQETAVTGEISLDAPLATGQRALLEGLKMRLNLRRIGRDTLERALFSLDPYERNEQLVSQRKLLRNGNLNWLRAGTLDGSFSLEGEVRVKGVNITLPPVERIRLADLPISKQMAKTVSQVTALRKTLDLVRSDTLLVGPEGKISLVRRNNE